MKNPNFKQSEEYTDSHLLYKASRSSMTYSNLPYAPIVKQSIVNKKKGKNQENIPNSSQSFTHLSKHLYSNNSKKSK